MKDLKREVKDVQSDDAMKSVIQEVVQELYDDHKKVTASMLVDACRAKDSPAHDAFEWDNKKAAEGFRLMQARTWLRKVVIRVVETSEPERMVHVPVSAVPESDSREGYYRPVSIVVQSVDEHARALNEAMAKLSSARRAVDDLQHAAEKSDHPDRAIMLGRFVEVMDEMRNVISSWGAH